MTNDNLIDTSITVTLVGDEILKHSSFAGCLAINILDDIVVVFHGISDSEISEENDLTFARFAKTCEQYEEMKFEDFLALADLNSKTKEFQEFMASLMANILILYTQILGNDAGSIKKEDLAEFKAITYGYLFVLKKAGFMPEFPDVNLITSPAKIFSSLGVDIEESEEPTTSSKKNIDISKLN